MPLPKKLLFIINKFSGKGFEPKLEGRIIDICRKNDAECNIQFTQGPGHATALASNAAGKFDAVAAVGGDGTVNEVARGLVHTNTPMGIIPKGSGNGLARHLHIPLSVTGSTQLMFRALAIPMDTFIINQYRGFNVAGLGFDGHIANLFGQNKQRGFSGYARLVVKEYYRYKEFQCRVITEKEEKQITSFMLGIANSSQYGNNAFIAPHASVQDGELDLATTHQIPAWLLPVVMFKLFTRQLNNSALYESIRLSNFQLLCDQEVFYHVDGEPCGKDKSFSVKIEPKSLMLLVPAAKSI